MTPVNSNAIPILALLDKFLWIFFFWWDPIRDGFEIQKKKKKNRSSQLKEKSLFRNFPRNISVLGNIFL